MENIINDAKQDENNENFEVCGHDIGCLIEGETLGTEAAEAYLEEPAIASLPPPARMPTNYPTIGPEPSSTPIRLPITVAENESHQFQELPKSPLSGSMGDPHCECILYTFDSFLVLRTLHFKSDIPSAMCYLQSALGTMNTLNIMDSAI